MMPGHGEVISMILELQKLDKGIAAHVIYWLLQPYAVRSDLVTDLRTELPVLHDEGLTFLGG
jgi:hypothetical protein